MTQVALPSAASTILSGAGSPEGAVVASPGALYLNSSGGAGTTLYKKESGTNTNTGWIAGGGGGPTTFMGGLTEVDRPRTDEAPTFVTVTGGAVNTKGAYSTLIASSAADATMLRVQFGNSFVTATQIQQLVDIATGAAASESVIIANIQAGSAGVVIGSAANKGIDLWFPVNIPAGTRISARMQDAVGSDTVDVHVSLYGGGLTSAGIDTMGAATGTSNGVSVTAGANAYGAWTEISASTAANYRYVIPSIQTGEVAWTSFDNLIQIGTGAAAAEVAILTEEFKTFSTEVVTELLIQPFKTLATVPSGTRLSVRIWGGVAADVFRVVLHGVEE